MERRRMRRKPSFGKRMMVTMLSLVMLLSLFSPGLLAGAEETAEQPTQETTGFLDNFMEAYDQQTLSGGEMNSQALTYVARLNGLKDKVAALDSASETYASDRQALVDEAAGIYAEASEASQNGGISESEWNEVTAAYQAVGGVVQAQSGAAASAVSGVALAKRTVNAFVDEKNFAVTGNLPEGVTLSVEKLDSELAAYIRSDVLGLGSLPAGYTSDAYDIKLMLDGNAIQPSEAVTLGITAAGITSKADVDVYHLPNTTAAGVAAVSSVENSSLTSEKIENVNCYDAGYYAFFTNGFSVYYITTGNLYASVEEEVELNEVATGYVTQYAALRAKALLLNPESETYAADQEALGLEAEAVDNAAIASYENGEFDEAQWNVVSQASADFYAALFGEESIEMEDASTYATVEIQQGSSGTINNVSTNSNKWIVTSSATGTSGVDGISISKSGNTLTIKVDENVTPGVYYIRYRSDNRYNTYNDYTVTVKSKGVSVEETFYLQPNGSATFDIEKETDEVLSGTMTLDQTSSNNISASVSENVITVSAGKNAADGAEATFVASGANNAEGLPVTVTINVIIGNTPGTDYKQVVNIGETATTDFTGIVISSITGTYDGLTVTNNGDEIEVTAAADMQPGNYEYTIIYTRGNTQYESTYTVVVEDPYTTKTLEDIENEGSADHLEVEVTGTATLYIDGNPYTQPVSITTSDTFTVSAKWDGYEFTGYSYTGNTTGNGSQTGASTVKLSGTYPTGTKDHPVIYTITLTKNVTFTLEDNSTMTVPVTLSVDIGYWWDDNMCPGTFQNNTRRSTWTDGGFCQGSGIDVDISGVVMGQAITEGKLAIAKKISSDSTDTSAFQFYITNSAGKYLTFDSDWKCTGTTDTLSSSCYITVNAGSNVVLTEIPVGIYRITEVQKSGYVIVDADGNESNNYTVDYVVEEKTDDDIPIANFTNKKLVNEARMSIKKVGTGLTSGYPNPTVSIYAVDGNGNKAGDPVWTGSLTTNGDTLYPNVDLTDGATYLVEEVIDSVAGYNNAASVTIDGKSSATWMFTASKGTVHNIVITNAYTERTESIPDEGFINVQKVFTGISAEDFAEIKDNFKLTISNGNKSIELTGSSAVQSTDANGNIVLTWKNVMVDAASSYTITEAGFIHEDYEHSSESLGSGSASVTIAQPTVTVTELGGENSCSQVEKTASGISLLVIKGGNDYVIWTTNTLTNGERYAICKAIKDAKMYNGPDVSTTAFFSGSEMIDEGITYNGGTVYYDGTTLKFDKTSTWSTFKYGTYTTTGADTVDVALDNNYAYKATDLTVTKTIDGNLIGRNDEFDFEMTINKVDGTSYVPETLPTGATIKDGTTNVICFTLKADDTISFVKNIPVGAKVVITELNAAAYDSVSATVDDAIANVSNGVLTIASVDKAGHDVVYKNVKDIVVDTGIQLDSYPFFLMLSFVIVSAGFFILGKKRMMF